MAGNVWDWTADRFRATDESNRIKSTMGGSFLCHKSYCHRYRIAALVTDQLIVRPRIWVSWRCCTIELLLVLEIRSQSEWQRKSAERDLWFLINSMLKVLVGNLINSCPIRQFRLVVEIHSYVS